MKYCEEGYVLQKNAEWRSHLEERYELLKREHFRNLRSEEEARAVLNVLEDKSEEWTSPPGSAP